MRERKIYEVKTFKFSFQNLGGESVLGIPEADGHFKV